MKAKTNAPATQRAVDAAADKLLATGIRPTVPLVHEAIGGSPRGLRAMLDDWRNRLARRVPIADDSTSVSIPEERAEQIVRQSIDTARGTLRDRIRTTRKRLASMSVQPAADGGRAQGVNIERTDLARLERELLSLQTQLSAQVSKLNEVRTGVATLEKRAGDLVREMRKMGTKS